MVTAGVNGRSMKIAVASGKGGTGKTFVATNLFYALQNEGLVPTLLDCDAEAPNAGIFFNGKKKHTLEVVLKVPEIDTKRCTYCGKCHEYCNYNAVFIIPPVKVIRILEELCHGCGACLYACNEKAINEKEICLGKVSRFDLSLGASMIVTQMCVGVYSPVKVIQAGVRETNDDPLVIMDSPPGTSCPFIQTVVRADYVLLVTEPTPFGLSDLKHSITILKGLDKSCGVIINRSGMGDRAIYDFLQQQKIPLLMEIPFDKSIAAAYAKGDLVAMQNKAWCEKLFSMFNLIVANGNSHH